MTKKSEPVSFLQIGRKRNRRSYRPVSVQTGRSRIYLAMLAFVAVYLVIGARLSMLAETEEPPAPELVSAQDSVSGARPDIVDRNGEILATDLKTFSLYAEPRRILDADEAFDGLRSILPELGTDRIHSRLASHAGFIWLKREITPAQQKAIYQLGLPGIGFLTENKRFYPSGPTASHILGTVNVDNQGLAGMEKYIDNSWLRDLQKTGFASKMRHMEPVRLSIDLRVQHVVRDVLKNGLEKFQAKAAVGIVLDANTGEVVAMSSYPDYDSNDRAEALDPKRMNRATGGVFEMGSVFKGFTIAMALADGSVTLNSSVDATHPIHQSGRTIRDFHARHRILSVPEVFIFSSNIGVIKIMLSAGIEKEKEFFERLNLTTRLHTELPEVATPLMPRKWTELAAMTAAFGHGIAVSPMQTAVAAAALVNGGYFLDPTFLPRDQATADKLRRRVISPEVSRDLRYLYRLNVVAPGGSGKNADVPGYLVGGKTGTAEKIVNGKYSKTKVRNSFLAAFPIDHPRYVVLVMIDDPQGYPRNTAGYNAAPMVGEIIRRSAPMLGVQPHFGEGSELANLGQQDGL